MLGNYPYFEPPPSVPDHVALQDLEQSSGFNWGTLESYARALGVPVVQPSASWSLRFIPAAEADRVVSHARAARDTAKERQAVPDGWLSVNHIAIGNGREAGTYVLRAQALPDDQYRVPLGNHRLSAFVFVSPQTAAELFSDVPGVDLTKGRIT